MPLDAATHPAVVRPRRDVPRGVLFRAVKPLLAGREMGVPIAVDQVQHEEHGLVDVFAAVLRKVVDGPQFMLVAGFGTYHDMQLATDDPLPIEARGQVLICGSQVMSGYLDDPEATAVATVEIEGRRWFRTGDRGHLTEEGFLVLDVS